MAIGRTYQVAEVARFTGVSVRTLHHYHEIGLLVPSSRTEAGYRLYTETNLVRLQQILVQRVLGLPLAEIRRILDDPRFDAATALKAQRAQLQQRLAGTNAMIKAIDRTLAILESRRTGAPITGKVHMADIFKGFDPAQYEAEAERRWGGTDAYKESARRTKAYGPDDWRKINDEQAAIYQAAVDAMAAGTPPDDPAVLAIADAHRRFIERWFYPCNTAMHEGLADMYEADTRFAENIDKFGAGLTPYLARAIRANAARSQA